MTSLNAFILKIKFLLLHYDTAESYTATSLFILFLMIKVLNQQSRVCLQNSKPNLA